MPLASMKLPLSSKQKSTIAIVARKAYDQQSKFTDEPFDAWRAREAVEACGKRISESTNGDFNKLLSHFENLAGNSRGALNAAMRADTEEHRQIMHAICQMCYAAGKGPGYAETIFARVFKVPMTQGTPEQLHKLRMTLKKRFRNTSQDNS